MDPHRIVCAVMVCLLGATRLSSGDRANCTCAKIPPKRFTVQKDECFEDEYRYECSPGYTRKPGTSSLIRCQEKDGVLQWAQSHFECIPHPEYRPHPTISMRPSSTLQSVRTSTSQTSTSTNTEQSTLGPSSTLQSVRTSTSQTSTSTNTEQSTLGGEGTTVCISLIGVILLVVVCGVIFFLFRKRNKTIPPGDPQELEAMKC